MSAAAAATASEPAPSPRGKKKLILIAGIVALVLAGAGAGTVLLLKKNAAAAAEAEAAEANADSAGPAPSTAAAKHDTKHDPKSVPVFVPLDSFTVNLADREAERYAQLAVTLEIEDAKIGDQIKSHMPAIRNNILLAIADRTAGELLGREGKMKLAEKIKRETARALGYEVPADDDEAAAAGKPATLDPKAKKKKATEPALPVKAVHFSNFIIQ